MRMLTAEQERLGQKLVGTLHLHNNHAMEAEKLKDPSMNLPHRRTEKYYTFEVHGKGMERMRKEAVEIAHELEASEIVKRFAEARPRGATGAVRSALAKRKALSQVRTKYSTPEGHQALVTKWVARMAQHQLSRIV